MSLTNLKHSIVAELGTAQCRRAAVAVDQLAALLAPASLSLGPSQRPLGRHCISARGQVAQGYPDWLRVVPHAAAIYRREDGIIHKRKLIFTVTLILYRTVKYIIIFFSSFFYPLYVNFVE